MTLNFTYCKWFTVAKLFVQQFWTLIIRSDCRIRAVNFTRNDHILFHILYFDTLQTLPKLKSQIFIQFICAQCVYSVLCLTVSVQRTGTLTWQPELTLLSGGDLSRETGRASLFLGNVMWEARTNAVISIRSVYVRPSVMYSHTAAPSRHAQPATWDYVWPFANISNAAPAQSACISSIKEAFGIINPDAKCL